MRKLDYFPKDLSTNETPGSGFKLLRELIPLARDAYYGIDGDVFEDMPHRSSPGH